jgi:hypothetical protein
MPQPNGEDSRFELPTGTLRHLHELRILPGGRICGNRKDFLICMPPLDGHGSGTSVLDAQLPEDLVKMVLHGVSTDPQDDGDLFVRFALANPFGNLLLARAEMIPAK